VKWGTETNIITGREVIQAESKEKVLEYLKEYIILSIEEIEIKVLN
jgi:hypothetical protein